MSHISANVIFQDGTILYGEYDGDQMLPSLYGTITEVMEHWRCGEFNPCDHDGENVIINPPGGHWKGKACKECMCITDCWMPEEVIEGDYHV